MQLTAEQESIIKNAPTSRFMKVNAFAGSGKTTVLKALTETYTDKKFLYLVFGKAMADDAQSKFGDNTKVCTINSLALSYTREELNIKTIRGNYKPVEIKNHFNITDINVAVLIVRLFDEFCNSSYKDINSDIITKLILNNVELTTIFNKKKPSLSKLTNGVLSIWNDMYHKKLDMVHCFYLKYFHLSIDRIQNKLNYDYVLLDECQDTNAITLDILNSLNGKKIIVGDRWQQIYGFRGSVNAMDKFDNSEQYHLTRTFRFNNTIAKKANYILNDILDESGSIVSHFPDRLNETTTRCHISRTNSGVISLFVRYSGEGKIVKTVRTPEEIFKLPLSLYYFLSNRNDRANIKVPYLYNFNGRAEIKEYAEQAGDIEMLTSLKIVEEHWDGLISIFEQAKANRKKRKVDMYLTTAHTCKGLEWDEVWLHDDFPDLIDKISTVSSNMEDFKIKIHNIEDKQNTKMQKVIEEFNLFYVSITRALYKVHISIPNSQIFNMTMPELDSMISESKSNKKK